MNNIHSGGGGDDDDDSNNKAEYASTESNERSNERAIGRSAAESRREGREFICKRLLRAIQLFARDLKRCDERIPFGAIRLGRRRRRRQRTIRPSFS